MTILSCTIFHLLILINVMPSIFIYYKNHEFNAWCMIYIYIKFFGAALSGTQQIKIFIYKFFLYIAESKCPHENFFPISMI